MHNLNVLIFGPSSFISTLDELKPFLKFNPLLDSIDYKHDVILIHNEALKEKEKKNFIKKSFLLEAKILIVLDFSIKFFLFLSPNDSLWIKITSCLLFLLSYRGLNFKKGFSSSSVEINEEGPKIKTFNLCIF